MVDFDDFDIGPQSDEFYDDEYLGEYGFDDEYDDLYDLDGLDDESYYNDEDYD